MPASRTVRMPKQTETDIAVLQVQVHNIEKDIGDIKKDVHDVYAKIDEKHEETHDLLNEMQSSAQSAHKSLSDKINALEKWRWMLMGAGMALGALGHNVVGTLLK